LIDQGACAERRLAGRVDLVVPGLENAGRKRHRNQHARAQQTGAKQNPGAEKPERS